MIGIILMIAGGLISIIGSAGLMRFPDVYTRSHAQTVINVGGVCLILAGALLDQMEIIFSARMIFLTLFIMMTAPVGTHAITKAAYLSGVKPRVSKDEFRKAAGPLPKSRKTAGKSCT